MQSIYETGVGDIDRYIEQGIVVKVKKEQNRRNPQSVIDIANALRTDGLIQQPSDDISAPNMENGVVKQGTVKFAYSKSFDLKKVKSSILVQGWDFTNAKETKELRLTHNLIANEAGFSQLMEIYDNDPIAAFKKAFKEEIKGLEFKNVLIVLHNGGWNNYNFEYLFNRNVDAMLTPAQKEAIPIYCVEPKNFFMFAVPEPKII